MEEKKLKSSLLFVILLLFGFSGAAYSDWNEGDPNKMYFPQLPDPNGWDVNFDADIMFDDWMCSGTGPVSDIHFWLSCKGDEWDPQMTGEPCPIARMLVYIYADMPASDPCNTYGFSHPTGPALWSIDMDPFDPNLIRHAGEGQQGWIDWQQAPYPLVIEDDHAHYYQINLENIYEPFIQEEGTIYWLGIHLHSNDAMFGWKSSQDHWNDNAVYFYGSWNEMYDPCTYEPMDLAFVITSDEEESDIKWEQLPDPCYSGLHAHDDGTGRIIIADDWLCEGGIVTDLHWWGAFENIGSGLMGFHLSIHANDDPCCLPADPALWEADIPIGSINVIPTGVFLYGSSYEIIKYEYLLPEEDYFYQEAGETYWFDICALSNDPCNTCVWKWLEAGRNPAPILCPAAHKYWPVPDIWDSIDWFYPNYSDMAFVITSSEEEPNQGLKYIQTPDLSLTGLDVDDSRDLMGMGPWSDQILADDFPCTVTGPITEITIWGSWYHDELPYGGPNNVDFTLSIHEDLPVGDPCNPFDYSIPGEILWIQDFLLGQFQVAIEAQDIIEGYYVPCEYYYEPNADWTCWRYSFSFDPCNAFIQEGSLLNPVVYWLDVQALTDEMTNSGRFGWKTSLEHWNDDAVWADGDEWEHTPWQELRYPPGHPFEGNSIDLAFAITTGQGPSSPVIYVDVNAPGNNDGSSWYDAYNLLQDALADPCASEIWVADGTYKPDLGGGQTPGDRTASFTLLNGVDLYGGFAGYGAPDPDARDTELYETILSGDLAGNDVYVADPCDLLTEPTRVENSYNVVDGSFTDANTILDGFTITAGNANEPNWTNYRGGGMFNDYANCLVNQCKFIENSSGHGGAMWNGQSDLNISNCTFSRNEAEEYGGGVNFYQSDYPVVTDCTFSENWAKSLGGGIHDHNSHPTMTSCTFIENTGEAGGGGMSNTVSSNPEVLYCTFTSNKGLTSGNNGGGMYNINSDPFVTNCLFTNNTAVYGGGISNIFSSSPEITNCTFNDNYASGSCGGINDYNDCYPMINNCVLWGNTAPQINDYVNCVATVNYSDVQGGWTGAGTGNINADPLYRDILGRLRFGSPCIDAADNTAVPVGIVTDLDGRSRFIDDPMTSDTGIGTPPIVDMGAFEYQLPIHVDVNSPFVIYDGKTWPTAYNNLQDALDDANEPGDLILVADGTYLPSLRTNPNDPRTATFNLASDVTIEGGYAGYGAPDPYARDIEHYETILSGDLDGNDVYVSDPCDLPLEPTRGENCYHVVVGSYTSPTAVLDGFTITAGNANSASWPNRHGGGMFNFQANCTVRNCTFVENSSVHGGGMCGNTESNLTVNNCTFLRNAAESNGGGMDLYKSDHAVVANCVFRENIGNTNGGGGMTIVDSNSPTVINCSFISNKAFANNAGGLFNVRSRSDVINCLFVNNSAPYGGGMSNVDGSSPAITNCTFSANVATISCGGINDYNDCYPTINNCILWENTPPQITDALNSTATVNYSDVQGGWSGAGVGNIDADPCFVDPNGTDNTTGTMDDNYRLLWNSPCIDTGNNSLVPPDTTDLDDDADKIEPTPWDLDSRPRFVDGDCNDTVIVDMGAYEFAFVYFGDFDDDCDVDFVDFAILASYWMLNEPSVDIAPPPEGDGIIDILDLEILCKYWLAGK